MTSNNLRCKWLTVNFLYLILSFLPTKYHYKMRQYHLLIYRIINHVIFLNHANTKYSAHFLLIITQSIIIGKIIYKKITQVFVTCASRQDKKRINIRRAPVSRIQIILSIYFSMNNLAENNWIGMCTPLGSIRFCFQITQFDKDHWDTNGFTDFFIF